MNETEINSPVGNRVPKNSTAVSILLAEHQRLSDLYQHNSDMGDKLVTTYLTIISLTVALMLAILELTPSRLTLIPTELILLVIMMIVGIITYARMLERRVRSIEYLRAINRIHRYFVERDLNLQKYLYWRAYDDCPPVKIEGTSIGGLRDMVALINSVVIGLAMGIVAYSISETLSTIFLVMVSGIIGLIAWFLHQLVKYAKLRKIEEKLGKKVLFHTP